MHAFKYISRTKTLALDKDRFEFLFHCIRSPEEIGDILENIVSMQKKKIIIIIFTIFLKIKYCIKVNAK